MLRRFFHSQFFAKLFYELLPATIASAVGAYLINSYFKPPAPQPQAAVSANAELVQIMREQQALLSEYLKKSTEAHQRADQAVAMETDKLKAAERDAIQALREAKAAELRALAAAVTRTGEASERKLAARPAPAPALASAPPVSWPQIDRTQAERPHVDKGQTEKAVAGEPLQLHQPQVAAQGPVQIPSQAPNQAPAQTHSQMQEQAAAPEADPSAQPDEHGVVAKVKSTVSTLERLPSRVLNWFSDAVVPPRPPGDLPRPFMKAAM